MGSPRYLAAHILMPRFLSEQGAPAVLAAIERKDADYFIPVWMTAGFRFSPMLIYTTSGDYRVGVLTLPQPREMTEAWLCALVGKQSDPAYARYFLLEQAESIMDGRKYNVLGEWAGTTHRNHGEGPPITGDLVNDHAAFVARVIATCGG